MGDPSGIGPELLEKVIEHFKDDPKIELDPIWISNEVPLGMPTKEGGLVALEGIYEAVKKVQEKQVSAIVTAPISKEAMKLAGAPATDHTTLLKQLTGVPTTSMAFYSDVLKVVLATIHIPLREVPNKLSPESLEKTVDHTVQFCRWFGVTNPRIALAGLNPHAGEGGLIGDEESWMITVAQRVRDTGVFLSDPLPPDTVFRQVIQGAYDVVIALYHDQGLIPLKLLAFDTAVNVTLGLPFIRTSPDHGTAYDIVGKGCADPSSMISAIQCAFTFAQSNDAG